MKNKMFIQKKDKIVKSSDYCESEGDKRRKNCLGKIKMRTK